MESDGVQADPADYDSLLPPRKRLLAGMKRQNCDFPPPPSFISGELGAHFNGVLSSSNLSPEEIVDALTTAALAAARAAAAARATATEKAVAAVKAKAFARSVLESVASVSRDEHCRKNRPVRKKIKKKHVPVEILYKSKCPVPTSETDEELARRLHRAMNSSPRISRKMIKKVETSGIIRKHDGSTICNGSSISHVDGHEGPSAENSPEKVGGRVVMCSGLECPKKIAEVSKLVENYQCMGKGVGHGRRGRNKQKKLPLSQCCKRAREDFRQTPLSEGQPLTREPKYDSTEGMPKPMRKPSNEEQKSLEAKPAWKCNKFKISPCHSEGKNLHSLCSIPAVTTTSALVKVD